MKGTTRSLADCLRRLIPLVQSAAGREARAEAASLKGELSGLQSDLQAASGQLEAERAAGELP